VKDLHTWYPIKRGLFARTVDHVKAVRGVSFEIYPGETLALVGESGCGKTTLGRTLMKLEHAHSGSIRFEGVDLLACSKKQDTEGRQHIQMVFQDPYSALNPRMKIWNCLTEALVIHGLIPASEQRSRAQILLEEVGLGAEHLDRYPHEFSGGQRQRICIARALGLKPKLIILDESLSALDVSIQAQVLDLLQDLKQRHDLAYLFISHDLSVVSQVADRIAVMKNGQIVEMGPPSEIVAKPKQAYTQALMASIPVLK
jgi:ABC-type oligopeptide transport system ATPase subunit